jgi:hypothetical protein
MNVSSPCILICKLDDGDVCTGCNRTREEIARWLQMTDDEKARVKARLSACASECEAAHE